MSWRKDQIRHEAKRTILIVEDNELNREMLGALLENDFNVLQAANGFEGLEQLEQHYQDLSLVLLDVYMPECDGFEFLRRKRLDERYDTVPVIVATASASTEDEIACLEAGANDFIVKPYNFEIMMNRINNLVRLRESASIVNQLMWDDVTGLYRKEFFYQAVEDAFTAHPDKDYDLVCGDVENFNVLTDRYGEEQCGLLLHSLADRLVGLLPGHIAGGRIGTDMLAFLVEHQGTDWETVLKAAPDNMPLANVNVKFGIVEHVDQTITVPKSCSRAISALGTVKGLHDVSTAVFDDELHKRQVVEQVIRESMVTALEEGQFTVYYQPKHVVRTDATGGAEALVRWTHPELGFISPGVFIPLFEKNGFITKLDQFVWEEACKELKRLAGSGLPVVPISVNASRLDFDDPDLPAKIAAIADKHGVDHSLLHVELTETAYSDNPEAVAAMLEELKRQGFSIELDDFGAGYSSLVSLNTLPLDVMKLDMSMVRQATELDDFRIIESVIGLARSLGLSTVVEGVETIEQARRVSDIGCDLIQGFYYSKPLQRDEFERYLAHDA